MAKKAIYLPDRGDIVMMNFSPQSGTEQSGTRPALVLTPKSFNEASGLLMACPITRMRRFPEIEVEVPKRCGMTGVILVAHLKSLDWTTRKAKLLGQVPHAVLAEVGEILKLLLPVDFL